MKLAKFKRVGAFSYEMVGEPGMEADGDFTRCSEYVDVEFPPLAREEVVIGEINALDKQRDNVVAECNRALVKIADLKSKLLAIGHESEATEAPPEPQPVPVLDEQQDDGIPW